MIKVVIIDDESIIRIGLKAILTWDKYGFIIVGEATNGREGLELILKESPDLVITDIKMPQMDGIELIRETYEFNKDIKFIIMSGYGEFNLIRTAMKLGAIDYIMKLELGSENLLESLKLYKEKYYIMKNNNNNANHAYEKRAAREREFISFMLFDQPDEFRLKKYIEELDIKIIEKNYAVAFLFTSKKFTDIKEQQKIRDYYLRDIPLEILGETLTVAIFEKEHGSLLLLLSTDRIASDAEIRLIVSEAYVRIQKKLCAYLNCDISISVGNIHHQYSEITHAVEECQKAYREILYHEKPGIVSEPLTSMSSDSLKLLKEDMRKTLISGNQLAIYNMFENIKTQIASPEITYESALETCKQFAYYYLLLSQDENSMLKRLSEQSEIMKNIKSLTTVTQVTAWLDSFKETVLSQKDSNYSDNTGRNVLKAQKYISSRVYDKVTLNDVANHLHLSPNYLSSLFKRYTGKSFTEYFNTCKINKAKELISMGNYKIYEISGMLGFDNSYYFSKVFKKIVGLAPTEYEENLLKNN